MGTIPQACNVAQLFQYHRAARMAAASPRRIAALLVLLSASEVQPYQSQAELKAQVLAGYDKSTRPSAALAPHSGTSCVPVPADVVHVQMYVEALTSVDQKSLSYGLEGYLRAYWRDPRLAFNSSCVSQLTWRSSGSLWTPDIYFEQSDSDGHLQHLQQVF